MSAQQTKRSLRTLHANTEALRRELGTGRRTYALQIGEEASKLPHHQTLPEALLRAVGEAQLGETVIVLELEEIGERLKISPLAKIGPYS